MSDEGVTKITPENLFTRADSTCRARQTGIELLLRAPKKKATYKLSSLASDRIVPAADEKFNLARFVVARQPGDDGHPGEAAQAHTRISRSSTRRISSLTARSTSARGRARICLTGFGFTINGVLYQEMVCPTRPKVGTCEEWRIENKTADLHPFHLHENSFQLIAINDSQARSRRDLGYLRHSAEAVKGGSTAA